MGPRAPSWAVGARRVMGKVKVMAEMGWWSPGLAGSGHCLGQVEKSCLQQNQPLQLHDVASQ